MTRRAPLHQAAPARDDGRFALGLTLAWLGIVGAIALGWHEPWRDEAQAWMLARDSATLAALAHNARYEGHPLLWHLVLFAAARLSRSNLVLPLVHLLVAGTTAYVVARWAPFTRRLRTVLVFGYFLAYEYAVVARSYALGAALLVVTCALLSGAASSEREARRRGWIIAATLGLLPFANAFALVLAIVLAVVLLVEAVLGRRPIEATRTGWSRPLPWLAALPPRVALRAAVGIAAVVTASAVAATRQIVPPSDASFTVGHDVAPGRSPLRHLIVGSWGVHAAYAPVPDLAAADFTWQSNLIAGTLARADLPIGPRALVHSTATGLLLLGAALMFRRARVRAALLLWLVGTGAYAYVLGGVFWGGVRHQGHLYLVLFAATWLAAATVRGGPPAHVIAASTPVADTPALGTAHARPFRFFTVVAWLQLGCALILLVADAILPFSGARGAAAILRARGVASWPMVGARRDMLATLAAQLDRPIWFVEEGGARTFVAWGDVRARTHPDAVAARYAESRPTVALRVALERLAASNGQLLLILDTPLPPPTPPSGIDVRLLGRARGMLVREESYWLYALCRGRCPSPSR